MATDEQEQVGIEPPAYQLPAATRLGRVRPKVADLSRSLRFYEEILGLRATGHSGGQVTLGSQEAGDPLVELVGRPGARPMPRAAASGSFTLPSSFQVGRLWGSSSGISLKKGSGSECPTTSSARPST